MHKISNEFEFRPDPTTDSGVRCPLVYLIIPITYMYNGRTVMTTLAPSFFLDLLHPADINDMHKCLYELKFCLHTCTTTD